MWALMQSGIGLGVNLDSISSIYSDCANRTLLCNLISLDLLKFINCFFLFIENHAEL